jgi:hypothetical protein
MTMGAWADAFRAKLAPANEGQGRDHGFDLHIVVSSVIRISIFFVFTGVC